MEEKKKEKKSLKTRINPSSLPGSSPVAPCWRASKASRESVSNPPSYPKGEGRAISTAWSCFFLSAGVPSSHGTVLHNGHSAVCARLRACFGAELGASVRHGRSSLVLLLVNEP